MKNRLIYILQKLLGFENYLFVFALFIYYKLRWDKNERDFLKIFDLISDDGIVLDIGANIGVMTAHFAKHLKNSTIYSFEPIPTNINTLKRIITFLRLKNVSVNEYALSNFEGDIEMIMPIINSAKKQGLSHVVEQNNNNEDGVVFKVPVKLLDNIVELQESTQKITAIKIDVEGHELHVLKGAVNTLKKHQPIIYCELWPGEQRNEVIDFMNTLNYNAMVLDENTLSNFANQPTQNFYFIPTS